MTDLRKLRAAHHAALAAHHAARAARDAANDAYDAARDAAADAYDAYAAARDAADAAMTDDLREAVARALAKADNVNGVGWVIYLPKADAALTVARSITFDAANDAYRDALAAQEKETEQ